MKKPGWKLAAVAVVAAVIAGIAWQLPLGHSTPSAVPAAVPASPAIPEVAQRPVQAPPQAPADPPAKPAENSDARAVTAAASPGADNPYLKDLFAADRRATFDRLALSNDAAAAKAASELAISCQLYGDTTYPKTLERIDAGKQSPEIKAMQRAVAERERGKCVGFDIAAFAKGNERAQYVFEKGDPRGMAYRMTLTPGPIPDRIAAAQEAARLNDPLAIMEIAGFFTRRGDVPRGIEYDLGDGVGVRTEIVRDAFNLAACSYGYDCGPQNPAVSARCVNAGQCQATSLEDSYARYNYSPADAERLTFARQVVLEGLRTGRWPPNFWDPRR